MKVRAEQPGSSGAPMADEEEGYDLAVAIFEFGEPKMVEAYRRAARAKRTAMQSFLLDASDPMIPDFSAFDEELRGYRTLLQLNLLRRLRAGELYATGLWSHASPDQPAIRIHPSRWSVLEADFEDSEAQGGGQTISGILVFGPQHDADVVSAPRGAYSPSDLRAWYQRWVKANGEADHQPSRDEDLAAAREVFGKRLPRAPVRKLRSELSPPDWRRFGRRPSPSRKS
jgi:hypothetical protein